MAIPRNTPNWIRQHLVGLRALVVLTAILGIAYPLAITAIAQVPGLRTRADGSMVTNAAGQDIGSAIIGQSFTDAGGRPLLRYFQSRPSAATASVATGYDPTATSASNLGPEDVIDTLDDPATRRVDESSLSLLSQVCTRSHMLGRTYHVDGARPYCTRTGLGAVLAVFYSGPGYSGRIVRVVSVNQECPEGPFLATYKGTPVQCHRYGEDIARGERVLIRGDAPADPAVPSDAVTASGSGLDPDISPAFARLQIPVVSAARHLPVSVVTALVNDHTSGRLLGFLGEPSVNVLMLNLALDELSARG
jgi:K+-transporting ATPase ATPase C chain